MRRRIRPEASGNARTSERTASRFLNPSVSSSSNQNGSDSVSVKNVFMTVREVSNAIGFSSPGQTIPPPRYENLPV